jgi:hypothetical protein
LNLFTPAQQEHLAVLGLTSQSKIDKRTIKAAYHQIAKTVITLPRRLGPVTKLMSVSAVYYFLSLQVSLMCVPYYGCSVLQYHPDIHRIPGEKVFAEEKFRRAAMAYESLMSSLTSLT